MKDKARDEHLQRGCLFSILQNLVTNENYMPLDRALAEELNSKRLVS